MWCVADLAERILGGTSAAALVSIRRAASALEAAGLIMAEPNTVGTSRFWRIRAKKRRRFEKKEPRDKETHRERRSREAFEAMLGEVNEHEAIKSSRIVLAKILGMLGSDHEGEVLSAAGHAENLRRKLGLTWEEILGLGGRSAFDLQGGDQARKAI